MSVPTSPQAPLTPAGITPEKLALADAVERVRRDDEARRAAEARGRPAQRRPAPVLLGLLILVGLGGAWALATRPAWLFTPTTVVETPPIREASLRMAMYTMARRLEGYRAAKGAWPDSMRAVAVPPPELRYTRTADGWRLDGTSGALHLTLSHGDSLPLFLGSSYRMLAQRAGR